MFFLITAVRVLSLTGSHNPAHLPRMPSNTVLISLPAVGAAQILIWSYSCVFLPPMSTAIRASVFSFVGALSVLLYFPWAWSLPSWSCGFNLWFVQPVGRFWVFFLSQTASGFQLWSVSTSACGLSTGVCSWGYAGGLGWGSGVEVVQLLGLQGFWQHQVGS